MMEFGVHYKSSSTPFFNAKITPPAFRRKIISREHVQKTLSEYQDARLILISGPAGYGKTSLLVDYTRKNVRPWCWLSLDEADTEPLIFVTNLVQSICYVFPELDADGQFLAKLLELVETPGGLQKCAYLLINKIQGSIREHFDLILDGYPYTEEMGVLPQLLNFILYHLPANCRILMSCRSHSGLNLTPLLLKGEVVGLGLDELKLNSSEVYNLLTQSYQLAISQNSAEELTQKTEGWVTGIVLDNSHILRQQLNTAFMGQDHLSAYFETQVMQSLAPEFQNFLIGSSVLEYLHDSFCDKLLGNREQSAAHWLQECVKRSLFISKIALTMEKPGKKPPASAFLAEHAEASNEYYRYHPLFRNFLLKKLKQTSPQRYYELHRQSAQLYKQQDELEKMMYHLLKTQNYSEIVETLLSVSDAELKAGHAKTVQDWINVLPDVMLSEHPDLKLIKARALSLSGANQEAQEVLNTIDAEALIIRPDNLLLLAKVAFVRGKLFRNESRLLDAKATLEKANQLISDWLSNNPDEEKTQRHTSLRLKADIELELGICLGINGQYSQALHSFFSAEQIYAEQQAEHRLAHVHQCLSLTYNGLGDSANSKKHLKLSLQYWRAVGNVQGQVDVMTILAGQHLASSRYDLALTTLQEALQQAEAVNYYSGCAYVLYSLGNLYRDTNQLPEAVETYQRAREMALRTNESRMVILTWVECTALYRALGDYGKVEECLEGAAQALPASSKETELLSNMLHLQEAGLHLDKGNLSAAEDLLNNLSDSLADKEHKRVHLIKLFLLGRVQLAKNQREAALNYLRESLDSAKDPSLLAILALETSKTKSLLQQARTKFGADAAVSKDLDFLLSFCLVTSLPEMPETEETSPEPELAQAQDNAETQKPGATTLAATKPPENLTELADFNPQQQPLVIYGFGQPEVLAEQKVIKSWRTLKAYELFFFLLEQPQPVRKETILDAIWPDTELSQVDSRFRLTLHRLRRAIAGEWIQRVGDSYKLQIDYWYDVQKFRQLIQQAEKSFIMSLRNTAAKEEQLKQAFDYYQAAFKLRRGPFLPNIYSDWCLLKQEELDALYLEALLKQAEIAIQLNLLQDAQSSVERCLELDKCNDAAHLLRLRIYHKQGQASLLKQSYQTYCQLLQKELGLQPSPEVKQFYMQTLQVVGGS